MRERGGGSQSMLTSPTAETVQTSQHPNASLLVDRTSYLSYGFSYLQWVDIIIADATHMLTSLKLAKAPFNGSNSEEREREERKSKTMGAFWWGWTLMRLNSFTFNIFPLSHVPCLNPWNSISRISNDLYYWWQIMFLDDLNFARTMNTNLIT